MIAVRKCLVFLGSCLLLLQTQVRAQHNPDLIGPATSFRLQHAPFLPSSLISPLPLAPFYYQRITPRGAVFCRMENIVAEKYHFGFKIHAGEGDGDPGIIGRRK
jgi:hypothetical protein